MASRKLSRCIKEEIARLATNYKFGPLEDKLNAEFDDLVQKAYNDYFPQTLRDAIAALPIGWVKTSNVFWLNVGGYRLEYSGKKHFFLPYQMTQYITVTDPDMVSKMQGNAHRREKLRGDRYYAKQQLLTMLAGVGTTNQLRELWPEGAPFFEKFETTPQNTSITVVPKKINELFGLPIPDEIDVVNK